MKISLTQIMGGVIGILLLALFIQNSCNRDIEPEKPIDVVVPEKKVTPDEPVASIEKVVDTFYIDRVKYIPVENKPDAELLKKYKEENDSLKKQRMYEKAVTKNTYRNVFEDDNIKINMLAETTGTLDKLSVPSYTIKETTIPYTPKPKSSFAVYAGGELAIPTTPASSFDATAKLYVQHKGMQYSGGYSVRGTASVGLAIKL